LDLHLKGTFFEQKKRKQRYTRPPHQPEKKVMATPKARYFNEHTRLAELGVPPKVAPLPVGETMPRPEWFKWQGDDEELTHALCPISRETPSKDAETLQAFEEMNRQPRRRAIVRIIIPARKTPPNEPSRYHGYLTQIRIEARTHTPKVANTPK
jgi:hypothetical protein